MNSTDLHSLLAASPVSRTTFFTQLLIEPRPQSEKPFEEPTADGPVDFTTQLADFAQPCASGFSA